MPRHPRRRTPTLELLEPRRPLSADLPLALWVGQDGHDYAGGTTPGAGNGVQDVHIELENLRAGKAITSVDVLGYGSGEWVVNKGPYNVYNGDLFQTPGATSADLYIDPYQAETGRAFTVVLDYDDGSSDQITMNGGTADPNLPMPADAITAAWDLQDGEDLTGPGPDVGPDGIQDARIALNRLYPGSSVTAVTVTDTTTGLGWAYGLNPGLLANAEFVANPSDPTRGELDFSPSTNIAGDTLDVNVTYADGKLAQTSLTAGAFDPTLAAASPSPVPVNWSTLSARWVGQDGLNLIGPGDVHLTVAGLPSGHSVVSATVSDQAGIDWSYHAPGGVPSDPNAGPLGFRLSTAIPTTADLTFPPARSEAGATLTLLVTLDDGEVLATRLNGGAADPGLRVAGPSSTTVVAHPGDDLNALANAYGTVRLASGIYSLDEPLTLHQPVNLIADPGTTLLFTQDASDAAWTAAIKVLASHTTLSGFAVRFGGPVRWDESVSYGPTVVGTTDVYDPYSPDPLIDETFTHLDLEAPPASTSWEEAPALIRMTDAQSGFVTDNTLKGGDTLVFNGPWQITGNTYLGTLPDTYAYEAFGGHDVHDVTIADNVVAPNAASGKTWRFLVITGEGINDNVVGNTVTGVGPMDTDTVANPNAREVILNEAYDLHYEGAVSSVSADGTVVQIPTPQGGPARTGDVLSILSGPQAGQWRMIAQVINAETYVLDRPITPGSFAVSLSTGFVNESYQNNTINETGSSTALDLVLPGNEFGVTVVGNDFLGGEYAFQLSAYASETPNIWGWSHAPFLGATITGNTVRDTVDGGLLDVFHSDATKSDAGRVYFSGTFSGNTGVWDAAYLATRSEAGVTSTPSLVTVGDALSADPGELLLSASGNLVQGPAGIVSGPTFQLVSGTLNGSAGRNLGIVLATVPVTGPTIAPTVNTPTVVTPAVPPKPPSVPTPTPAPTTPVATAAPLAPVATVVGPVATVAGPTRTPTTSATITTGTVNQAAGVTVPTATTLPVATAPVTTVTVVTGVGADHRRPVRPKTPAHRVAKPASKPIKLSGHPSRHSAHRVVADRFRVNAR